MWIVRGAYRGHTGEVGFSTSAPPPPPPPKHKLREKGSLDRTIHQFQFL